LVDFAAGYKVALIRLMGTTPEVFEQMARALRPYHLYAAADRKF